MFLGFVFILMAGFAMPTPGLASAAYSAAGANLGRELNRSLGHPKDPIQPNVVNWQADGKSFRSFRLRNDLSVLLISDPKAEKSSALMNVEVGGGEDPQGQEGMAHYLEHTLFLGTKTHPGEGEFNEFLSKYEGSTNAFTSRQETRYFFEIDPSGFAEATAWWSGFFYEPLFNPDFLEREKNAVNSEYLNSLDNDNWNSFRIFQLGVKPGHAAGRFWVGKTETLRSITRDDVVKFYDTYYSANRMQLILNGRHSLEELQNMAVNGFLKIPNKNRSSIWYHQDQLGLKGQARLLTYQPKKKQGTLHFNFSLPPKSNHWSRKKLSLVALLIGNRETGSLFDWLLKKGFITGMDSSVDTSSKWTAELNVRFSLTESGLKSWPEVGEAFFSYLRFLQKTGLPEHAFSEAKTMAETNYLHRGYQGGLAYTSFLGDFISLHPAHLIERRESLFFERPVQWTFKWMIRDELVPSKALVLLAEPNADVEQKDEHYDIRFKRRPLPADIQSKWEKPRTDAAFEVVRPNSWVPQALKLVHPSQQATSPPEPLAKNLWFLADTEFGLPKASVYIRLQLPALLRSPRHQAMGRLYGEILGLRAQQWGYGPSRAGIGATGGDGPSPVTLEGNTLTTTVSGYSEKLLEFVELWASRLRDVAITEELFNGVKQNLMEDHEYQLATDPYAVAGTAVSGFLRPGFFSEAAIFSHLDQITFPDFQAFVQNEMFSEMGLQNFGYGNLKKEDLETMVGTIMAGTGARPLAPELWTDTDVHLPLPPGQPVAWVQTSNSGSEGYYSLVQFGPLNAESYEAQAALMVLNAVWSSAYFNDLRTLQQLGYIVHMDTSAQAPSARNLTARFIVQSQVASAAELGDRTNRWLAAALQELPTMPPPMFSALKEVLINQITQPDKTMEERFSRLVSEAFILGGDFTAREHLADALRGLAFERFLSIIGAGFDPAKIRRMTGYISARGKPLPEPKETWRVDESSFTETKARLSSGGR